MSGFDAVASRWRDLPQARSDLHALARSGLAIDTDATFVVDGKIETDIIRTLFQIDGDVLVILPDDANGQKKVTHAIAARHCAHVARRMDALVLLVRVEGTALILSLWGGGLAVLGSLAASELVGWTISGVIGLCWSAVVAVVRHRFARWAVRFLMPRLLSR